jgi:hypothetical protein
MQPSRRTEIARPLALATDRSNEPAGFTVELMERGIVKAITYDQPVAAGSELRRTADRRSSAEHLSTQQLDLEQMIELA